MINKIFALPVVEQLTPVLSTAKSMMPILSLLITHALKPQLRSTVLTCSPGNRR
jgi:hypothetical protein